jgi:hypothetical protein
VNKRRLIPLAVIVAILAAVAAILAIQHRVAESNRSVISRTYQIGQDLIAHARSPQLSGLPPGLAGQLGNLLNSPTHIAAVLLGDEPPPVGDGSACSRLILTNQMAKGLELRLCPATVPGQFRVMGYWPVSSNPVPR